MSPQTMTGALTGTTLGSSVSISLALNQIGCTFSQSALTSASGKGLHVRISAICLSRLE